MKIVLGILGAAALMAAMALPATAQQTWPFGGLNFPARDGWCPTFLGDSMEVRRCGTDFPYLSVTIAAPAPPAGQVYNVEEIASGGAAQMEAPGGPALFADIMQNAYGKCSGDELEVLRNPVPGVSGFTIVGALSCAKGDAAPQLIDFRNFSGFVKDPSGGVWVVSYDYPQTELGEEDIALIQSIAATIARK